jgi:geranylgeranyl pyrophosphate synthase
MDKFPIYKDRITEFLGRYFRNLKPGVSSVNRWENDVLNRLEKFNSGGKKIRGSLVLLSFEMSGKNITPDAVKLAAAVEIASSSLLIHDDILDDDRQRRGEKSVFAQYGELAVSEKLDEPDRFGRGMGIINGDYGFFLAYALLTEIIADMEIYTRIVREFSDRLKHVCLGEMQDYYLDFQKVEPVKNEILKCYIDKTANYSFCWPLRIGAMLAGTNPEEIQKLTGLGENLGIIYQLKDDELGVMGDEKITGKPVGADIREGKKTLYDYYLREYSDVSELKRLNTIVGNITLKQADLDYVRDLILKYGIQDKIDQEIHSLQTKSRMIIDNLTIGNDFKNEFNNLLEFLISRHN